MPPVVAPMLASPGELPTADDAWAYEPKWDGIRAITRLDGKGTLASNSRNSQDLSKMFPELGALCGVLGTTAATLDGELVALDDHGIPRFGLLQARLNLTSDAVIARRAEEVPASYIVFDVLHLDGTSLLDATYDERRSLLETLDLEADGVTTSAAYREVSGADVFAAASSQGLEGIVAKRRASRYQPGSRSHDWTKIKAMRDQEVVIGGWLPGQGHLHNTFGALLLGIPSADGLSYVGKVGTGFNDRARAMLLDQLADIATETSPFTTAIEAKDRNNARYVEPRLVGEVRYGEWTRDGRLRHPSWRGVRPDKSPSDVRRE
ncbi:MAG TPA: non-homologous end-joining DNA ligase [Mycobacteriales bacterium]|jgi:bifunctional non-homologous end joining protein LigD|nr:non-homologous end-joining DNA ligase [Mycobacteriales bacterium]